MVEITPPTYDEVVFGDGSMAQIIKVRRVDKDGIEGREFILNPSKEIIEHFGLNYGVELHPVLGYIKKWYPKTAVISPSSQFPTARWLITTDFEGNKNTSWFRKHIEDTELIEDLQRENQILKLSRARVFKNMESATSQIVQFVRDNVAVINEARKAGGRIQTEEEAEEKEQEQTEVQ